MFCLVNVFRRNFDLLSDFSRVQTIPRLSFDCLSLELPNGQLELLNMKYSAPQSITVVH